LKQATLHFQNNDIAAVGGPAITPPTEPLLQKASGRVFESLIVSGPARFRYVALKKRLTDDFPSCNFIIRRNTFLEIGGFRTKFWPGEDTILCSQVVHELNRKIVYDPLVLTYHHRRSLFKAHIRQIANYAKHRGYFVKRFPKTSLRLGYFLPSILVTSLVFFLVGALCIDIRLLWFFVAYIAVVVSFSFSTNRKLFLLTFLGILVTHAVYGTQFIAGLCAKKLKEE